MATFGKILLGTNVIDISRVRLSVEIGLTLYYCLQGKRIVNTHECVRAAESCSLTKKIWVDEFFSASKTYKILKFLSENFPLIIYISKFSGTLSMFSVKGNENNTSYNSLM